MKVLEKQKNSLKEKNKIDAFFILYKNEKIF